MAPHKARTFQSYQVLNTSSVETEFSLEKVFGCLYCRYKTISVLQNRGVFFSGVNMLKQITEY